MFEISQLKEKKLLELQEIAKELKVPKFSSLKKIDLVYQILDLQAANPTVFTPVADSVPNKKLQRPIRRRISKPQDTSSTTQESSNQNEAKPELAKETLAKNKASNQNQKKKEPAKEMHTNSEADKKRNS
jgi:transcription termination factor Rho